MFQSLIGVGANSAPGWGQMV